MLLTYEKILEYQIWEEIYLEHRTIRNNSMYFIIQKGKKYSLASLRGQTPIELGSSTKWAETKAIKVATKEKVAKFLRENIFYKFGYPRELVTDQGSQFTSNLIEDRLAYHKIKHRNSTPYHPQANG